MEKKILVIGAGLAGSEAAWQIAKLGIPCELYEMKPQKKSPAHKTDGFAELVCSNSFRSNQLSNAIGVLKAELLELGSLIMEAAYATEVPAGGALAVNRELFSQYITNKIRSNPLITIHEEELKELPSDEYVICATGPLTSEDLSHSISTLLGGDELHFFDAAAPIVDADSIDFSKVFYASRYGKGNPDDYLNCPMTKEEYDAFYQALVTAELAKLEEFDVESQKDLTVFEGCMPVEVMAQRGYDTLRFGPMKPVGLEDPKTGKEAYATVQLRKENIEGTMFNLVGFQTHLTWPEQRRVFRMIPGLENADFIRYGVMHRNTYINSPSKLSPNYEYLKRKGLYFAGQMTGVEGYIESASSGFIAGIHAARSLLGLEEIDFTRKTCIGSLGYYVSQGSRSLFQPMNANFGILESFDHKIKGGKKARNEEYANRALEIIKGIKEQYFK